MSKARRITKPQMTLLEKIVGFDLPVVLHKGLFANKDYATFRGERVNLQTVQALIWRGLVRSVTELDAMFRPLDVEGYVSGWYLPTRYGRETIGKPTPTPHAE